MCLQVSRISTTTVNYISYRKKGNNTHKLPKLQLLIRKWLCMNGVVGGQIT